MEEFKPTFAEVCVKVVLFNTYGNILLLQRRKGDIGGGKWDLPGGMLEDGEKPVDGLVREVGEEAQIKISRIKPVFTHGAIPRKIGRYTVWIWFSATTEDSDITLCNENSAYKWISSEEALIIEDDLFPKVHKLAIKEALGCRE